MTGSTPATTAGRRTSMRSAHIVLSLIAATAILTAAAPSAGANPLTATMPALGLPSGSAQVASSASPNRTANAAAALPPVRWSLVTTGGFHTCAYLAAVKEVRCWGSDRYGQTDVPLTLGAVKSLSAGAQHTCAVTAAGSLACWGANDEGQAEDPEVGPVSSVSAGAFHTCIVGSAGAPYCWGDDTYGQTDVPESLERVRSISAGPFHTCAVNTSAKVVCWGAVDDNPDEAENRDKGQAEVPSSLGTVIQVSAGGYHTCAIKTNRELECWGYDYSGQSDPTEANDLYSPFKQVSAGLYHTCALTDDGGPTCFGSDDQGQSTTPEFLGIGTAIAAGGGHGCAQSDQGELACWGNDGDGQASVPNLVMLGISKTGFGKGTVEDDGEGFPSIDCGSRCLAALGKGSQVTLHSRPDRGSRFIGWSGACGGRSACTVTMSTARSVVANFASNRPCIVPRTAGATLQAAGGAIAKAGCTLGTVSRVRSRVRSGVVISSTPGAGAYRPLMSRVALVVSRGSR